MTLSITKRKVGIIVETEDYVPGTPGLRRSHELPSTLVNFRKEKQQQQMSYAELKDAGDELRMINHST